LDCLVVIVCLDMNCDSVQTDDFENLHAFLLFVGRTDPVESSPSWRKDVI